MRRVLVWLGNLRRPASERWSDRATWWGVAAYLAAAVLATVFVQRLGDRWWPATTLLFGPRWVLLLPLPALAAVALLRDRALLVPLALAGLLVLGPVMGLRTGWRALLVSEGPEDIRVASFNARGGEGLALGPEELMLEWGADVAAFQECGPSLRARIRRLAGWHSDTRSSLCLLSRWPILDVRPMERRVFQRAGGSALVVTYRLAVDGRAVFLTNVHLETPRAGLALIREGRLAAGIPTLEEKSLLRTVELRRAREWVDDLEGPRIVVGDFNTPVESRAYQDAWGDWRNAFSRTGHGLGGTRLNGWIRARIDHVVVDDAWTIVGSWLGRDVGSDHRPILAELRLR